MERQGSGPRSHLTSGATIRKLTRVRKLMSRKKSCKSLREFVCNQRSLLGARAISITTSKIKALTRRNSKLEASPRKSQRGCDLETCLLEINRQADSQEKLHQRQLQQARLMWSIQIILTNKQPQTLSVLASNNLIKINNTKRRRKKNRSFLVRTSTTFSVSITPISPSLRQAQTLKQSVTTPKNRSCKAWAWLSQTTCGTSLTRTMTSSGSSGAFNALAPRLNHKETWLLPESLLKVLLRALLK